MTDAFDPTPRKERTTNVVAVRLQASGRAWLDDRVAEHDVSQTEVIKAALAFASTKPAEFKTLLNKRKEKF